MGREGEILKVQQAGLPSFNSILYILAIEGCLVILKHRQLLGQAKFVQPDAKSLPQQGP